MNWVQSFLLIAKILSAGLRRSFSRVDKAPRSDGRTSDPCRSPRGALPTGLNKVTFRSAMAFVRRCAAVLMVFCWTIPAVAQTPPSFEKSVAPILIKRCLECHGETDPSGKLNLTSHESVMRGGETGPAVVKFDHEKSLLVARITSGEMPPPKRGHSQKLPEVELNTLIDWIIFGAQWPEGRKLDLFESTNETRAGRDWWSLQAVKKGRVPEESGESRAKSREPEEKPGEASSLPLDSRLSSLRSPLDAFIVSKLHAQQMEPAPQADRATLIKRLSFDLLGLPPSFDDIETFVNDPAPDAYERLVDRLLASPHFGERWARHWLDLVRYADTSGYERDQEKPGAWRYRDWVVRAINEDTPYSRFITEQLAGDELPDRNEQSLIATGFLRLGTWNDEPNDAEEYKYDRLEDLVGATSTAFLGYTIKCARCHDHKFDPIQQTDYYRMAAAFWPGPIEQRGRELLGGPSREELDAALGLPPSAVSPINKPLLPDLLAWTDIRPAPPIHLLKKGEPKHPGAVVEPAAMSFLPPLAPALRGEGLGVWGADGEPASQLKPASSSAPPPSTINRQSKTAPLTLSLSPQSRGEGTKLIASLSSSRRTDLARWIAHPENPLTWRVVVNRLWTHHFGNGLVRTPDNFGFTGERPTHPELLDWLAGEVFSVQFSVFSEEESSRHENALKNSSPLTEHRTLNTEHSALKRLHRLIVTSATYRQSSIHPMQDEYSSRDAANQLWWHAERRRLDAESLRDRMLFVGDSLDSRMAGPGFKVTIQPEALEGLSRKEGAWKPSPAHEQLRRSLYSFSARSLLPPLMTTFDFGDTTLPCGQRPVSTVAPQALALLNNAFAHERSTALATRVMSELISPSGPLAPRLRGERAGVRGASGEPTSILKPTSSSVPRPSTLAPQPSKAPLTLTLSPEDGGEGTGKTDDALVLLAWRFALGREPSPSELTAGREHLIAQRRRFSNEPHVGGGEETDLNRASAVTQYSVVSTQPVLHLRADSGVKTDAEGRVLAWTDASENDHSASQTDPARRPLFVKDAVNNRPALRFDGQRRFLHLNGQVLTSQSFAIFAVVTDRATTQSHREILSNWNGAAGNSGSSLFLGMTGEDTVRLSDDFSGVGHVTRRVEPFLLSGFNGPGGATVHQNDVILASKGGPIASRNLTTAYVIGQQGNIDGEYWHGDLFELLVYNRNLFERDRLAIQRHLSEKYHIPRTNTSHDPDFLALASLCHVLLNTNEFAYVD